ncbi:class I SAM-dependent methyltransferase [soil metagenome]
MTLAAATFGSGGSEPYASALRRTGSPVLYLRAADRPETVTMMDVSRWHADADDADLTLLRRVAGPVLDIGCGPGRMVRAAQRLGLHAVGLDVSPVAIELASRLGGSYVRGSVFDRVPGEGMWQTALLVDGNVGIGGDIPALLARCRQLLAPTGEIVVELHDDPDQLDHYLGEVTDAQGGRSASFPWAEIGLDRLVALLPELGLELAQSWLSDGRSFCRLAVVAK